MARVDMDEFVQRNEGFRDRPYDDANGEIIMQGYTCIGHPTIGWGQNLEIPMSIEALNVDFRERLERAKDEARLVIPGFDGLDHNRQVAFTDMAYQMGARGLSSFKLMIGHIPTAMRNGRWDDVVEELMDSKYASEDSPERAERVATLILEGSE